MTNLSVFHVIAHDEQGDAIRARKTLIACKSRLDSRYANWLSEDFTERWAYVEDEARDIITATAQEFNDSETSVDHILSAYKASVAPKTAKTAATTHEARLPRMCPFHKDVTEISLAEGSAKAGFDAMAQHWGGPKHCQGDGYEGESCKFKPEMVTQSYWDTKAEKAQERKEQREQQAEQEALQPEPVVEEPVADEAVEQELDTAPAEEMAEVTELPVAEAPAEEIPMAMAASTKTADGGPVPTMNKRKWTPRAFDKPIDTEGEDSRWPTKRKDIIEPIKAENNDQRHPGTPTEIGENTTEHQDVTQDHDQISQPGGSTWTKGNGSAVSSSFLSEDEVANAISQFKS